ncbi:hypothetical protein VTN96DRAFT_2120 [Rasamsonia emersonii]
MEGEPPGDFDEALLRLRQRKRPPHPTQQHRFLMQTHRRGHGAFTETARSALRRHRLHSSPRPPDSDGGDCLGLQLPHPHQKGHSLRHIRVVCQRDCRRMVNCRSPGSGGTSGRAAAVQPTQAQARGKGISLAVQCASRAGINRVRADQDGHSHGEI